MKTGILPHVVTNTIYNNGWQPYKPYQYPYKGTYSNDGKSLTSVNETVTTGYVQVEDPYKNVGMPVTTSNQDLVSKTILKEFEKLQDTKIRKTTH